MAMVESLNSWGSYLGREGREGGEGGGGEIYMEGEGMGRGCEREGNKRKRGGEIL